MNDRKHDWSWLTIALASVFLVAGVVAGCGGEAADEDSDTDMEQAEEVAEEAEVAGDGAPRVFFANLTEGEEVTSPVSLEFGIENFEIVPADDPPVVEAGEGHHHLGIGPHCLPAGEIIVKGTPQWVHFGDGSNTIDVQLEPGPAHLSLQVGDGEHRTLDEPGLCAMINVTVVQEGV